MSRAARRELEGRRQVRKEAPDLGHDPGELRGILFERLAKLGSAPEASAGATAGGQLRDPAFEQPPDGIGVGRTATSRPERV